MCSFLFILWTLLFLLTILLVCSAENAFLKCLRWSRLLSRPSQSSCFLCCLSELKEERRIIQRDLEVQSLMHSSCTTNNLTIKKTQIQLRLDCTSLKISRGSWKGSFSIHLFRCYYFLWLFKNSCSYRETRELAFSPRNSERIPVANHQTVASGIYSFHLKPCPPKDHFRTSVSSKQRNRLILSSSLTPVSTSDTTQHRTQEPCLNHDPSNNEKLFSGKSIILIDGNSSNVELNSLSSALEHGDMSKKYRGTSAFRLVPAASVGETDADKDLIKLGVNKHSDHGLLQPAPPAVQRTASRGRRGSRHLCVPQPDSLLSSLWPLQVVLTWRFTLSVWCESWCLR